MWYPKKTNQCRDNRFCVKQKQSVFFCWLTDYRMYGKNDWPINSFNTSQSACPPRESFIRCLFLLYQLSDPYRRVRFVSIDSVFKINLSFAESTTRLWQSFPFVSDCGDFCPSIWTKKGRDLIAPHVACLCFYAVRYQRPCSQGWWFSVLYSVVGLLQWVES